MSGFKLIAIRPLINCDQKFIKNLIPGKIYQFYNDYNFININKEVVKQEDEVFNVLYNSKIPYNLYEIETADGNLINVNISALVGENGSGKSSLLEFFFRSCYVMSDLLGLIDDTVSMMERIKANFGNLTNEEFIDYNDLIYKSRFEIYFSVNNEIYKIKYDTPIETDHMPYMHKRNNIITKSLISFYKKEDLGFVSVSYFDLNQFFYSIVINYSIYGLNSKISGNWIKSLFHKNDGYQTPLVINPFRTEGVIDINSEYHLAQSRLLLNIVDLGNESTSYIIKDKIFEKIEFIIDPSSLVEFGNITTSLVINRIEKVNGVAILDFVNSLLTSLVDFTLSEEQLDQLQQEISKDFEEETEDDYKYDINEKVINYQKILFYMIKYSIRKVLKICYQYEDYSEFRYLETSNDKITIQTIIKLPELITKLKDDHSHTTIKLYQALNSIKHKYFSSEWKVFQNPKNLNNKVYFYNQNKQEFISMIKEAQINTANKFEEEQLIPNAFFKTKIFINDDYQGKESYEFGSLSSGEQQLIHSIQSILYHIKNLNSVFYSLSARRIGYSNINLILDEIELYYHPEYQRDFIKSLLDEIKRLKIKNIMGINILFSTHSPFILSDIPHQNILKLEKGKPKIFDLSEKTFGSNLYDLLKNDFFLDKGFIGAWAMEKIKEVLDYVSANKYEKNKHNNFLLLINLIGDEIISMKLKQLLAQIKPDFLNKKVQKISELEKMKRQIEQQINKLKKNG